MYTIGDPERLSPRVRQKIENAYALTKDNDEVIFNIALNYGGRQEIVHACREIAKACEEGTMSWVDIDEAQFADHLYTAGQPDPDLLIRSSGELRLSNFLLWQVAYSEFWITDTYWPDTNGRFVRCGVCVSKKGSSVWRSEKVGE